MVRFSVADCCTWFGTAALQANEAITEVAQNKGNLPVSDEFRADFLTELDKLKKVIQVAYLPEAQAMIQRIIAQTGPQTTNADAQHSIGHLSDLIRSEIEKLVFFAIPPADAAFYEQEQPFGSKDADLLKKKFKKALNDIKDAGNCVALGQGTACVLHLARAMEVALQHLARRIRAPIKPTDTWGRILTSMNTKIENMPKTTTAQQAKRDRWSETRTHLFHVKGAWRDRPMHAKQDFTSTRAKEIFEAVRVFMIHFATL